MTRLAHHSPCKINLLLNILGKRADGFHELETLMQPVALYDTLHFERRSFPAVELTCSNPILPVDSSNLVHRAASSFLQSAGIPDGIKIHLEKNIPLAAGLGGGSGNAATTLRVLNQLFERPLSPGALHQLAASLGSDVPFFLQPFPALATGRGEQITPLEPFGALENLFVLLVHPGFGVSTQWAYQALAQYPEAVHGEKGRAGKLIALLRNGEIDRAAPAFYNSLEAPVLRKYPILSLYQEFLRGNGALASLMSGSGSSTFALFRNEAAARAVVEPFRARFGASCWTAVVPLAADRSESTG